ncbi:glycosyltransferase family 25 protein [Thalassotalea agarivorans]|uniref:Glycosyl transferase, family 25 n=1 Tax=Thalassotalea agarivorans TaxID=349064 RepID=A0A1H9YD14_THASX|nr:glycosyltransferase family 25 protein [Thalassotalea agarivorans]SES66763.1 glycosyl transferase, family 25 [Thalassotalea agarivorans]
MPTPLPIFVINLDRSKSRWQQVTSRLSQLNLEHQRVSAVDGKTLQVEDISQVYSATLNKSLFRYDLTLGEIGCYLSHRHIWQTMVDQQIPYAVILEDDINIQTEFAHVLDMLVQYSDWELVKLGDDRDLPFYQQHSEAPFIWGNYKKIPNCTLAYAISLSAAKKLLSREKFYRPIDIDMQFPTKLSLNVLGLKPYAVSPNLDFDSEIVAINKGKHKGNTSFWRNLKYRIMLAWQRKKYTSGNLNQIKKAT